MRVRAIFLLAMACAAAVAGWWFFRQRETKPMSAFPERTVSDSNAAPPAELAMADKTPSTTPELPSETRPASNPPQNGSTVRRVFRLALEKGHASLEAVQDVRGDFHPRRQKTRAPGMLCCRLLDARNQVLAEETLPAPDAVCVALDPHASVDGQPQPAQFTVPGPVLFQIPMPKVENATLLAIYRLEAARPAAQNAEPPGRLLAAIPLSE